MKLVVGLGNPGKEYEQTRHNLGFLVLDKLSKELAGVEVNWQTDKKHQAEVASAGGVVLVKPFTFMNASGTAVGGLTKFYKISPLDVIVVHDDLDLPLGKIRLRARGGSGGHNGVQSILTALGSDEFIRVRLGIGRGREVQPGKQVEKFKRHQAVISFVLSRFGRSEAGELRKLVERGVEAIRVVLLEGLEAATNRFH